MKKKETTIFFRRCHDETEIKIEMPTAESTIPEMVDSFLDFLRGCGYTDPEQYVLEYVRDNYDLSKYNIKSR